MSFDHDDLTARFAAAWKRVTESSPLPRMEDFLCEPGDDRPEQRFATLLRIERSARDLRGDVVHIHEYLDRFPQFATIVASVFHGTRPTEPGDAVLSQSQPGTPLLPLTSAPLPSSTSDDTRSWNRESSQNNLDSPPTLPWRLSNELSSAPESTLAPSLPLQSGVPSQCIGPYRIVRILRHWSGGPVYLAEHVTLHRPVELFVFNPPSNRESSAIDSSCLERSLEQLFRGAKEAVTVNHPHLGSAILEAVPDAEFPYVAREYVERTAIRDFLPRSAIAARQEQLFPNRELARRMEQAASALAAIHQADICHHHLSVQTVVQDNRGVLRILGLGEPTADHELALTPIGEEQADSNDPLTNKRHDLACLGDTFYEWVTGQRIDPLPGTTLRAEALRKLNGGVSMRIARLIEGCVADESRWGIVDAQSLASQCHRLAQENIVPAKFADRLGTWYYDAVMVLSLYLLMIFLVPRFESNQMRPQWLPILMTAIFPWIACEFLWGWSLGRRIRGLRLADSSGQRPKRHWIVLRRLLTVVIGGTGVAILHGVVSQLLTSASEPILFAVLVGMTAFPAWSTYATALLFRPHRTLPDWLTNISWVTTSASEPEVMPISVMSLRSLGGDAQPAASTLLAGQGPTNSFESVDQFQIRHRLGSGGMGTVFAAWDSHLQRSVALKVLRGSVWNAASVRRLEREARLAAQLNHPNVARVLGQGQSARGPYIAMELIDGQTLHQLVTEKGPLPLADAWKVILQIASGLSAANQLGIVHRDIKPSNVILTPDGTAKVTDFGLSKQHDLADTPAEHASNDADLTQAGAIMGTPMYMSPEQIRGEPVDFRSDLYSLGLTLYHLLIGRPPFESRSIDEMVTQQYQTELPTLEGTVVGWSAEHEAVIRRMTAKDREVRYGNYAELMFELRATMPKQFNYAHSLTRIAAYIIDFWPVYLATSLLVPRWPWLVPLRNVLIFVAYTACLRFRGQTPGKWLLGLKVIPTDGDRLGWAHIVARTVVAYPTLVIPLSMWNESIGITINGLSLVAQFVSVILIEVDPQRRTLHDWVAGTRVVTLPKLGRRRK